MDAPTAGERPPSSRTFLDSITAAKDPETIIELGDKALTRVSKDQDGFTWACLNGLISASIVNCRPRFNASILKRVLAGYEAAQTVFDPVANASHWLDTQRNLAATHALFAKCDIGNVIEHFEASVAAYKKVLAIGKTESNEKIWTECARELVMVEEALRAERSAATNWARSISVYEEDRSDSFNLPTMAKRQCDSFKADLAAAKEPERDPHWHAPSMLNEEVMLLRSEFERFAESGKLWKRTAEQRSRLECERARLFRLAFENVLEKYATARQVQELFDRVRNGETSFVLLLRGFSLRSQFYSGITVTSGTDFTEQQQKVILAQKLAPIPLVLVANPVESGPLEAIAAQIFSEGVPPTASYRVAMATSGWEDEIKKLIANANFIVVHNPEMTPGIELEIKFVEELGRRSETFFVDPEKAAECLGIAPPECNQLTDGAIDEMRASKKVRELRSPEFPPATCLWVAGVRRDGMVAETTSLKHWIENCTSIGSGFPRDLLLDAYMYFIGTEILLECLDYLPAALRAVSAIVNSEDFEPADKVAKLYAIHAEAIDAALADCAVIPDLCQKLTAVVHNISRRYTGSPSQTC